ncbi:hypothetical protein Ancab_000208 [Ancistrocladus abbreviatus]
MLTPTARAVTRAFKQNMYVIGPNRTVNAAALVSSLEWLRKDLLSLTLKRIDQKREFRSIETGIGCTNQCTMLPLCQRVIDLRRLRTAILPKQAELQVATKSGNAVKNGKIEGGQKGNTKAARTIFYSIRS